MQIISDFHDYYDIGMQNGIDPQLPYRRFRREEPIQFPNTNDFRSLGSHFLRNAKYYCFFYIGFAGKIWSCMDIACNMTEPTLCFEPNLIDESLFIDFASQKFCWKSPNNWQRKHMIEQTKKEVTACFEYKNRPELLGLFEKFKTAIFVYKMGSKTAVINERLNQYGFQKVLPPMQAFQELAMYVGSYLTKPVIEEPTLPDKIKAEIHGFDQFSFRKDKR